MYSWYPNFRYPTRLIRRLRVFGLAGFFGLVLGCAQPVDHSSLLGAWTGSGPTIPLIEVQFLENGEFHMRIVTINGDDLTYDGEFETDFTKTPVPLSMRSISQLPHAIHTIIELRGDETLRMGEFGEKWRLRPTEFNPANAMTLKKEGDGPA